MQEVNARSVIIESFFFAILQTIKIGAEQSMEDRGEFTDEGDPKVQSGDQILFGLNKVMRL